MEILIVSDDEREYSKLTIYYYNLVNVEAKLKKDRSGLVPINFMFSGFQCLNLVQRNFEWFNGFRITMRRP